MSTVNDYLDKCLAECPEGAEEILLGEIAKRLFLKHHLEELIEIRDRKGIAGYFIPAWGDIFDIPIPVEVQAMLMRETDPTARAMNSEESLALVKQHAKELFEQVNFYPPREQSLPRNELTGP